MTAKASEAMAAVHARECSPHHTIEECPTLRWPEALVTVRALEAEVVRLTDALKMAVKAAVAYEARAERAEAVENCGAEPCALAGKPPRPFGPQLCLWHEAKAHAAIQARLAEAERLARAIPGCDQSTDCGVPNRLVALWEFLSHDSDPAGCESGVHERNIAASDVGEAIDRGTARTRQKLATDATPASSSAAANPGGAHPGNDWHPERISDSEALTALRKLPDDSGFPDPFDGMKTPAKKNRRPPAEDTECGT